MPNFVEIERRSSRGGITHDRPRTFAANENKPAPQ
jgi:hypothetical protein